MASSTGQHRRALSNSHQAEERSSKVRVFSLVVGVSVNGERTLDDDMGDAFIADLVGNETVESGI